MQLQAEELNKWMVRQGWAIAYRKYSTDYVDDETAAKNEKLGIWASRFIEPEKWRRGERLDQQEQPSIGNCDIKGNISRSGERIYHLPGGRYYDRTKITASKGERMFCSEAEARAAGWRKSKRLHQEILQRVNAAF